MCNDTPSTRRSGSTGRRVLSVLCSAAGIVIFLIVIALLLPLSLPRLTGREMYNVVSGSMEPSIPEGSLIYVRPVEWSEIEPGDIIAFRRGGSVVTHRVVQVRVVEGDFVTKGDANQTEDITTVAFSELVGRVERHFPRMGDLAAFLTTVIGKVYLFALLLCGVLFHILARRVREV